MTPRSPVGRTLTDADVEAIAERIARRLRVAAQPTQERARREAPATQRAHELVARVNRKRRGT